MPGVRRGGGDACTHVRVWESERQTRTGHQEHREFFPVTWPAKWLQIIKHNTGALKNTINKITRLQEIKSL